MSRRAFHSILLVTTLGLTACGGGSDSNGGFFVPPAAATPPTPTAPPAEAPTALSAGAVASPDQFGAQAAKLVLDAGGNAVDAGVATAFALAVTLPEAGNIGGGGFLTLWMDGKPYFLDFREKAPAAATPTMYLDKNGDVIPGLSLDGSLAAGVPGSVAGMWEAQRKFGKLSWSQVLAPAIGYAKNGFVAYSTAEMTTTNKRANFNAYFGGKMIKGQLFKQPELAGTLQRIADNGGSEFYTGKTADLLVAEMGRTGGLISKDDLKNYRAVWRDPVSIDWNGHTVYTAPPPSSGGFGIGQLLKMKKDLAPQFASAPLNSAQYVHLTAEMEKRVFADRAQYLGDSDFYQVPMAKLLSEDYLKGRAAEVNTATPTPLAQVKPGLGNDPVPPVSSAEKPQTTHFSVVDKWGNAFAVTYTLNGGFGSGIVVEGAGFLLNNEMDDFSAKPGVPNQFGVVGGDVNSIQPNKRPLSSMSPTIAVKDGKVALVLGTPGGSRIFTAVYQVLVDVLDYKLPLEQAQAQPRFHHQLLPDNVIFYEADRFTAATADNLRSRGWTMQDGLGGGQNIQAIQIVGNAPVPVSDPRNPDGLALVVQPQPATR
ncbi:gamma-glutamyltransferase [Variovorax sp. RCC_210]|uniref:gamma-glutamyltransferase n=1 Tax=Variovorax sp. RCC_210 TaxID=3239217 RepID=UPI003525A5CA